MKNKGYGNPACIAHLVVHQLGKWFIDETAVWIPARRVNFIDSVNEIVSIELIHVWSFWTDLHNPFIIMQYLYHNAIVLNKLLNPKPCYWFITKHAKSCVGMCYSITHVGQNEMPFSMPHYCMVKIIDIFIKVWLEVFTIYYYSQQFSVNRSFKKVAMTRAREHQHQPQPNPCTWTLSRLTNMKEAHLSCNLHVMYAMP